MQKIETSIFSKLKVPFLTNVFLENHNRHIKLRFYV